MAGCAGGKVTEGQSKKAARGHGSGGAGELENQGTGETEGRRGEAEEHGSRGAGEHMEKVTKQRRTSIRQFYFIILSLCDYVTLSPSHFVTL